MLGLYVIFLFIHALIHASTERSQTVPPYIKHQLVVAAAGGEYQNNNLCDAPTVFM